MDIRRLPIKILKRIFGYLSFDEMAKLRGLSRSVHCAARESLNTAFLELGPILVSQGTLHLIRNRDAIDRDVSENAAFRGRLLKLLRSEHSILLAYCRHYIAKNSIPSFSAGKILDLFYELITNKTSIESQDEENNKVAKLVLLIDQYLDWFERYRISNDERCSWFGACIVDLLDSYLSAKYDLVASHSRSMVKLAGQYTINGYAEAPPEIGDPLGRHVTTKELFQVLRYVRKHARWHNFVKSFQDDRENDGNLDDEQEKIYTKETNSGFDRIYKKKCYSIVDSYANVVSLRAIINLQCHRSLAPARLINRDDAKIYFDDGRNIGTSTSIDNSMNDEPIDTNEIDDNSSIREVTMRNETDWFDSHRTNDGAYSFSLEIKSVHTKNLTSSRCKTGEKFGETTLNVNHTRDVIFAARSECRLY